MCIGLPLQVLAVRPGFARLAGRHAGEPSREVATALVGDVAPGDWLLVFLDSARELISAERAAEIEAALTLVEQGLARLQGRPVAPPAPDADPGFALPSAMSAADLARLTAA